MTKKSGPRPPIEILGINHIGLAPKDAAKAQSFFSDVLAMPHLGTELVKAQNTNTIMFAAQNAAAGTAAAGPRLEILENEAGTDGPIAKFLASRGGGAHHVALNVADITAALAQLKKLGVELIDHEPRAGAHHTKIAFIHPRATGGLLIELVEEQS